MANIHIKTAWDHIRRSPFQALSALLVLGVTFFVITILSLLTYSSRNIISYFETRPQVIAFLKDDVSEEEISSIKGGYDGDLRVKEVKYVSKEEALEIYKQATSDNPLLSELVSPSIFPASIEVSLTNLSYAQEVIDELKESESIEQVGYTASLGSEESLNDIITRLRTLTKYIRYGGSVFAFILVSTSFLVLIVIIGMRMTTRREEIEILKLIGATSGFVRSPILIESVIYSSLGVITGWTGAVIMILYTAPSIVTYFGDIPILPKNTYNLLAILGVILLAELLVGMLLALFGSILAVSRAQKKRK